MSSETRRSYQQFCGLARALDVVGERWTLLILRDMLLGPRRYSDLLNGLPGITTNLLAKRLKQMQADGLIEQVKLPPPASVTAYQLTAAGADLEPALMALARWGGRLLDRPREDDAVNIGWGLISLKRRYRGGHRMVASFQVDDRHFELTFTPDYLKVNERMAAAPHVTVQGASEAFRAWLFMGRPAAELVREGQLTVSGERFEDLLDAFGLTRG